MRANLYTALKDTTKALADLAEAIKANPNDEDAYKTRAQLYYEQQQYDRADADYQQLLRLDQGSITAYMGLGRNRNAQQRWEEAIAQLSKVVDMYGTDYSQAYAWRAKAYVGQQKWAEATDDIVQALAIDGDDSAFELMLILKDTAFEMMKAKMAIQATKNPNNAYWPYWLGAIHEQNKAYEQAIGYYQEAQNKDADDVNLYRIASCYQELGDFEQALYHINQAIELDTTKTDYIPFKADFLYEMGHVEAAIAQWDKYQALNPELGYGYYRRRWYKDLAGHQQAALDDYTMAITLNPEYAYPYVCRARLYTLQGKTEQAKADFQKVIALEETSGEYECLHYAYLGIGDKAKAIAAIDTIIARSENKAGSYYDAACLYARMNQTSKALKYLKMSLKAGYNRFAHIRRDYDLDGIRQTLEFKTLLKKYEAAAKAKRTSPTERTATGSTKLAEVPFTKEGGVCNVKCHINQLPLYFVFDTGATNVLLSMVEATFMMKNGYLSDKDVVGSQYFLDANGNVSEGTTINLREVDFGGLKLENVRASVVRNQKAPLLLGQSVLGRLGKIEIDNSKYVLRIEQRTF